jgi:nitrate reductase gamma subunit
VIILLAHLLALVMPDFWVSLHRNPARTMIIELLGGALGFITLLGIFVLIIRRIVNVKARTVTSVMDWILLVDLLLQVAAGFSIALFYRWGTLWYGYTATPWLASLVTLSPRIDFVTTLPWIIKFHMANAFVLIALFPFTRLVHIFTIPFSYLWRSYQVTIWNRKRAS